MCTLCSFISDIAVGMSKGMKTCCENGIVSWYIFCILVNFEENSAKIKMFGTFFFV